MADPRVEQAVGVGQQLDRLTCVSALQRNQAFDDLCVTLRLRLKFVG